jgi:DNA invertase Pin-like site-specific DNA recombinase
MQNRTAVYIRSARTSEELENDLRRHVEARGDVVVGVFSDHDDVDRRRHRSEGWKALLASLHGVDQIALASAGDIPGRTIKDLLAVLGRLKDHGVGLLLLTENIDTGNGSAFTVLEIIEAFRRAKLSQAIRDGQAKARAAGKTIGRPEVPAHVRCRIEAALGEGSGIRPTARKFGVSPASVSALKRSMAGSPGRLAA